MRAVPTKIPADNSNKDVRTLLEQLLALPEADPAKERAKERYRLYLKFCAQDDLEMKDDVDVYTAKELLTFFEVGPNGEDLA